MKMHKMAWNPGPGYFNNIEIVRVVSVYILFRFFFFNGLTSLGGPQILVGLVTKDLGKMGRPLILLTGLYKAEPGVKLKGHMSLVYGQPRSQRFSFGATAQLVSQR